MRLRIIRLEVRLLEQWSNVSCFKRRSNLARAIDRITRPGKEPERRRFQLTPIKADLFYSHKRAMGVIYPPGISQLPEEIEAQFQRLPPAPIFDNGHSHGTNGNTARCNRRRKIQDGDCSLM